MKGLTLVELLIGAALVTVGGGALLLGMNTTMGHTDYLTQLQIVVNAAQGRLEELTALPIDTLWTESFYAKARSPNTGLCMGLNEDRNCDGILNGGEDLNANGALDEPLPGARLSVMIRNADIRTPTNPTLLDLYVTACWQSRGRRIGEDQNCNGALDPGEDVNGDTLVDSPVALATRVSERE